MNIRGLIEPEYVVELILQGKMDYLQFRELFYDRGEHNYKILRSNFISEALGIKDQGINDIKYDIRGVAIYDAQGFTGKELYLNSVKNILKNRGVDDEDFYRNPNFKVVGFSGYKNERAKIKVEGNDEIIDICSPNFALSYREITPSPIDRIYGITKDPEVQVILTKVSGEPYFFDIPLSIEKPKTQPKLTGEQINFIMSLAKPLPTKSLLNFEFDDGLLIYEKYIVTAIKSGKIDYDGFENTVMKSGKDSLYNELYRTAAIVNMHNSNNPSDPLSYDEEVSKHKLKVDRWLKSFEEEVKKNL